MKSTFKSWPDFHHRINLIYHAVIAFSLIPFALVFMDVDTGNSKGSLVGEKYGWFLTLVLIIVAGGACLVVWRTFKEKLAAIETGLHIKEKLAVYMSYQVRRYFQLEFAAVISLGGLWLTASYLFVVAYLLVLVQFSFLRPSQDKVIRDLQFTKEEREQLRGEEF